MSWQALCARPAAELQPRQIAVTTDFTLITVLGLRRCFSVISLTTAPSWSAPATPTPTAAGLVTIPTGSRHRPRFVVTVLVPPAVFPTAVIPQRWRSARRAAAAVAAAAARRCCRRGGQRRGLDRVWAAARAAECPAQRTER